MTASSRGVAHSPSAGRVLVLPGVILGLLFALPWILSALEARWPELRRSHFRDVIDSGITLLLAGWVLVLLRREQAVLRGHLLELETLSLADPLTGLGNRRALERDLEVMLKRSDRLGEPLALLYLDVDGLKKLNDGFGHAVGDETLRALGAVLRSTSRLGTDAGYRVGGDEFVMVLTAHAMGAEVIAGRVATAFAERSPRKSHVSMGVVEWDGHETVADLLERADTRMYRHKRPDTLRRFTGGEQRASG